jgi:methylated-DNA-[protein]-cysteine S-methyltransferase
MKTVGEGNGSGADIFAPLLVDDAEAQQRLHARLVAAADAEGILDVAYRTIETPIGSLLLAATDRGLVRVAFESEDHDSVLAALSQLISPRVLKAPERLDTVAREIDQYFDRRRDAFDVPLDLRLARGFRREVLTHLLEIDYGTTATYAWVAAAAGKPNAVRAAGSACANNPIPVVVPCHRVVRSDGSVGRYAGGTEVKQTLLALEASA